MRTLRCSLLVASILAASAVTALAAPPQSPIKFKDAENENLGLLSFMYPRKVDLKLETTWKSAQMGDAGEPEKQKIEGSLPNHEAKLTFDNNTYKLKEFHLHHRSEHLLGDDDYPLEVHLVHEHVTDGSFLAVGLWIVPTLSLADENPALNQIHANLPPGPGVIDGANEISNFAGFNLRDLLLTDRTNFFRYIGSLTTFKTNAEENANQSETEVKWIMFKDPLKLSQDKINDFANHPTMTGARPPFVMNKDTHMLRMHIPEPSTIWLLAVVGFLAGGRIRRYGR